MEYIKYFPFSIDTLYILIRTLLGKVIILLQYGWCQKDTHPLTLSLTPSSNTPPACCYLIDSVSRTKDLSAQNGTKSKTKLNHVVISSSYLDKKGLSSRRHALWSGCSSKRTNAHQCSSKYPSVLQQRTICCGCSRWRTRSTRYCELPLFNHVPSMHPPEKFSYK